MEHRIAFRLCVGVAVASQWVLAAYGGPPTTRTAVATAIGAASEPTLGWGNLSSHTLQTQLRLWRILESDHYSYQKTDSEAWRLCLRDDRQSVYARMCAAYFLLNEFDGEARQFLLAMSRSKDLRHRYNAAAVLAMHLQRNPNAEWDLQVLAELAASGALDGNEGARSPQGDFPEYDRNDGINSPLDLVCRAMAHSRNPQVVSPLLAVLQRKQHAPGAIMALGELGDARACPALLGVLKDGSGDDQRLAVVALGELCCAEAVPHIIALLDRLGPNDDLESGAAINALLAIGDRRAIDPIRMYAQRAQSPEARLEAQVALIQFEAKDPVAELLHLLSDQTDLVHQTRIVSVLPKYDDERVVQTLADLARRSPSARVRMESVAGLAMLRNQSSLIALINLLDITIPPDFASDLPKGRQDFPKVFRSQIAEALAQRTGQQLGESRATWEKWMNAEYGTHRKEREKGPGSN